MKARTFVVGILAIVIGLGIIGYVGVPGVSKYVSEFTSGGLPGIVNRVGNFFNPPQVLVRPVKDQLRASSEVADHPIANLFDSRSNTDWRADGNRPSATVTFPEKVDLLSMYIYSGIAGDDFVNLRRPATLQFTFPDGSSQTVTLQDVHDKQFFELKANGVDTVTITVPKTTGPDNAPVAISGDRVLQEGRRVHAAGIELASRTPHRAQACLADAEAAPPKPRPSRIAAYSRRSRLAAPVSPARSRASMRIRHSGVLVAIDLEPGPARPDGRPVVAGQQRLRRQLARRLDGRLAVVVPPGDDPVRRPFLRQQLAAVQLERQRVGRRGELAAGAGGAALGHRPVEPPEVHGLRGHVQPVGVALAGHERGADGRRDLVQPAPQGRQRDVEAARAGGRVGLGPQRVLDDLAMDRGAGMDGEQAEQGPNARLGAVEQHAATVDVEREPAERADPDRRSVAVARTRPRQGSPRRADRKRGPAPPPPLPRPPRRRRRSAGACARGTTSPVSLATVSASSAYSAPRTSSTSASAAYAYIRAGCDPAARPADSAPNAVSRASGVPRLAEASAASPRAHASSTPAPRRRNSAVAASAERQASLGIGRRGPRLAEIEERPAPRVLAAAQRRIPLGRRRRPGADRVEPDAPASGPAGRATATRHVRPPRSPGPSPGRPTPLPPGVPRPRRPAAPPRRPPGSPPPRRPSPRGSAGPSSTSPAARCSRPRATGADGSSSRAASRAPSTGSRTSPVRSDPIASGVGMATGSSQAAIRCRSRRGASAARDGPNAASART